MDGLHHMHVRKRRAQKVCEPYPARTPALRFLDRLMLFVAICSPLALLPQVLRVVVDGEVTGLSIVTWAAAGCINTLWAVYGFVHKDKPILIANVLIVILDFIIVYGILKYS